MEPQTSMDHSNISRANTAMKDVDAIHFSSSQQATVTTTAAPVITVVAPSSQSTGWSSLFVSLCLSPSPCRLTGSLHYWHQRQLDVCFSFATFE